MESKEQTATPPQGNIVSAPSPVSVSTEVVPAKATILPKPGEVITSMRTQCTYTMGDQIGEGNFSHVFACTDVWDNELAAKVLKPLGTYEKVKENAINEINKLTHLRHPYVTFIFDAFEYRDTFYIITERCHSPIENLINMEGMKGELWLKGIARCVLQAIQFLHINNFIHQDIHPGNVFTSIIKDEMLPADPEKTAFKFKLGDLGIAKLREQVSSLNTRAQWMLPPEVLDESQFGPIDHRVDIYHAGLLFLQIAYGKKLEFTKEEILAGKPREMALQLSGPLGFALEKMLRRRVQFRTESALEAWRDLRAVNLS